MIKNRNWIKLAPLTTLATLALTLVGCAAEGIDGDMPSLGEVERTALGEQTGNTSSGLENAFSFPAAPVDPMAASSHAPPHPTGTDLVFPADATPQGRSIAEWGTRWWQWLAETPRSVAPVLGNDCNYNQTDDVFYLTGSFGTTDTRSCTIPTSKPIFFPLINTICWQLEWDGVCYNATEEELTACASADYDGTSGAVMELEAELDGYSIPMLEDHLSGVSEMFSWGSPGTDPAEYLFWGVRPVEPNQCGFPEGNRQGVTNGYWLMLKPLSPGQHTLHFVGKKTAANGSVFKVDLTYNLTQL